MFVYVCVVMCVYLGAAGVQTTWHPDVEPEVLLETQLLLPTNYTDFVKPADTAVVVPFYCIVVEGR